jgi:molybdopterin-guanine dinucleotide biosynthesis protein A
MISVVIQAGGLSSRMGQDKALMPFLGEPLIAHLARRLGELAGEMIVTTNQPEKYGFLGLPLYEDILPGMGALGGLYTALFAAAQPVVAVVACDMPFIKPELLRAQCRMLVAESADVVVPRSLLGLEPLHAAYRRESCLPAIRAALETGERKMTGWYPLIRVRVMELNEVAAYDPEYLSFINVNNPEEFRRAENLAQHME